jgi:hypothetical protein
MARYNVNFSVDIPDENATDYDVLEWLKYELGITGDIQLSNPLADHEIEAESLICVEKCT